MLINFQVTVIMNVHNGEEFISEAIQSVINQTYQNWELLIWDNLSTDNTFEVICTFKDKRIIYFKSEIFDELYTARNKAIDISNGDLITFLDSDDIWLPNKLEEQSNIMKDNKIDFCYSNFYQINKNSKKIFPPKAYYSNLPSGKIYKNLLQKYTVGILTLCLRKKSLIKYGMSFEARYSIIGDMVFVLELSEFGNCYASQNCLACYRTHEGSLSKRKVLMQVKEMRNWFYNLKKSGKWNQSSFKSLENLTNYQRARGLISRINIFQTIRIIFKINDFNLIIRFIIHYLIFHLSKIILFEKKSNYKKL